MFSINLNLTLSVFAYRRILNPYPWILDKKIQILGIELASFLDKKSRLFFLIYPHNFQKIFSITIYLTLLSYTEHWIVVWLFCSKMALAQFPKLDFSKNPQISIQGFALDFLSRNDASSGPKHIWIFFPKMTLAQIPGFRVKSCKPRDIS